MFLTRVQIENIRSIEELDLTTGTPDGPRRWTLLLGENGTGKSTVLRCIALALAGSDALAELVGDPLDWIRRGTDYGRVRVEMVTAEGEDRSAELVLRGNTKLGLFEENRESLAALDRAIQHSQRSYFTVAYGVTRRPEVAQRRSTKRRDAYFSPRAQSVATLFSAEEALTPLEVWAMDLDYRHEDGFEVARGILNRLLPGIQLLRIDREHRELIFETADGELPYRLLSDGYQHATSWVGDLLLHLTDVFGNYRDPLSAKGLLLVDEVDLHLHPVWQRELQRFITSTFTNLQVVCTTHSPLTAHQTGEGELYFLRRSPGDGSVLKAYDGAANRLMLHQLMSSPLFGFETVDSDVVENMRREYRDLRDRGRHRTPTENRRFQALADQLQDLPTWSEASSVEKDVAATLRRIEQSIAK
jgi:predicted ATPase